MSLELWIPDSAKPAFRCHSCPKTFTQSERWEWERHVARCSDEHYEQAKAETPKEKVAGIFGPESRDQELDAFISKHRDDYMRGKRIRL